MNKFEVENGIPLSRSFCKGRDLAEDNFHILSRSIDLVCRKKIYEHSYMLRTQLYDKSVKENILRQTLSTTLETANLDTPVTWVILDGKNSPDVSQCISIRL